MEWLTSLLNSATMLCYLAGAFLAGGAGLWIARSGDEARPDRRAAIAASTLTAIWCVISVVFGPNAAEAELAATARNLALIAVISRLFAADGRDESLKPIRPVIASLVAVQFLQPVLLFVSSQTAEYEQIQLVIFEIGTLLNMLVAVGALVLLHNLYASAANVSRQIIRWSGIALAGIFAYDLNLFTVAYLAGETPAFLIAARGIAAGLFAIALALGANATSAGLQFSPSRAVTFQTLSLLVIGSYLSMMIVVTRGLALLGGDIARASQALFLVLAVVAAILWLPSERMRGWLRVTAAKHLFQHRYDYREEWLRFTQTISQKSSGNSSFHQRAVKAIADITDSPAGLLLVPDEEARLELSARWNWATLEVPAQATDFALAGLLEQHNHILDLGEARAGIDHVGELEHVPQWLIEAEDAWAVVPLIHFDRLVGAIVLARPRIERRLDWEDFDLLRVVGQQLASYLAEQAGQQALMDASRFDEFNRRMAFVMHDIKNLASQLSLLSGNAQKHADNPAFRADMLVTLRNSSDKLNALLARLGRYGGQSANTLRPVDLSVLARDLEQRFKSAHPVQVTQAETFEVLADAESLEQALVHIVQNAVDASGPEDAVHISVSSDGITGQIEIIDSGEGMSPEFVRTGLFKPFVSSKQGGFGIGALEAREMIKSMGGRLSVESREGIGTRFAATLPVAETASLLSRANAGSIAPQPKNEKVA
ncbi:Periplasmic Sensor Signal Transduction Histidine Kinase [Erythrobacter sp. NAP1]|uniref:XrtA/PEP-CTERM system histidine kinase PrsK n=1 Tax=Erythrobacter sp. NAP1 TaxID=237727 RepID=UPI0000686E1A|nr:XrtA/PEP-CTERM system histidine kinase PrsK [Erythrobacter sp. NAP1]EAQ30014.1 Periplasmic Sensor Signal Transduction Histidine Kinase [Erythrobacter sp. NAP1]